jgi:hypothetical protein
MPQTKVENQFCSLPVTSVNPLIAEKLFVSKFQPEEKIFFGGKK